MFLLLSVHQVRNNVPVCRNKIRKQCLHVIFRSLNHKLPVFNLLLMYKPMQNFDFAQLWTRVHKRWWFNSSLGTYYFVVIFDDCFIKYVWFKKKNYPEHSLYQIETAWIPKHLSYVIVVRLECINNFFYFNAEYWKVFSFSYITGLEFWLSCRPGGSELLKWWFKSP